MELISLRVQQESLTNSESHDFFYVSENYGVAALIIFQLELGKRMQWTNGINGGDDSDKPSISIIYAWLLQHFS